MLFQRLCDTKIAYHAAGLPIHCLTDEDGPLNPKHPGEGAVTKKMSASGLASSGRAVEVDDLHADVLNSRLEATVLDEAPSDSD